MFTRRLLPGFAIVVLAATISCRQGLSIEASAARYAPGVRWRQKSILSGDFTCGGHVEHAILGSDQAYIVVAAFVHGLDKPPEILRYSAKVRNAGSAELTTESLDFDPNRELGYALAGFHRSKTCKGLNLSDGETDSSHIYWNHDHHRFEDWSL